VVAADLTGDHRPDLAASNGATSTLSVLVNTGLGTFAPRRDYAAGQAPTYLAALDLNADFKTDLLASNNGSSSLSLLLGSCQ
jgi:hypothetical protein